MQGDQAYQARQRRYADRCAFYDWQRQHDKEAMERGPRLLDDGHTLTIPSNHYHADAARFWRSKGFTFTRDPSVRWERDTRCPLHGKTYTPTAWLQAARRRFAEFYPNAGQEG